MQLGKWNYPNVLVRGSFLILILVLGLDAFSMSKSKSYVIVGGGIQGVSVAYHLAESLSKTTTNAKITILEAVEPASAASGKGGGFMARSWGDGSPTQRLHEVAFDMYGDMAKSLQCESYRKIPVLSVSPGYTGLEKARKQFDFVPSWLDGKNIGRISALGTGADTAQITPSEFVNKLLENVSDRVNVVIGTCTGIETDQGQEKGSRKVTAVRYCDSSNPDEILTLPADCVVVSAGPWSCAAEDWFNSAIKLPMEGIKSTSIVWGKPDDAKSVDGTGLFCGEDNRFGTHLEVYPRPDGTIYICGIGGSDYISTADLKKGAFRGQCDANPARVEAAKLAFVDMSSCYKETSLEKSQACMRPCPPDALPYMGKVPGFEGAYINAGHNCWGIAWAPACGKAMAELILNGACELIDLSPFDPARFTPENQRGGRGRKKQDFSVGEQW